jgi:hypothetical protein
MDTYLISAINEKNKNTTAARYWLVQRAMIIIMRKRDEEAIV